MATRLDALRKRMQAMDSQEIDKHFIGMIYGPPGGGKTTTAVWLAQSLANWEEDILYLDSADGWVSLEATPALMEHVTRLPLEDAGDLRAVAAALTKRSPGFETFSVIVVDELSSVAQDTLETYVREELGLRSDEVIPEIEGKHYGPMGQMVSSDVRKLRRVPDLHVIFVAHSREKKDNRGVETKYPQFSPLLGTEIQKIMHVTSYISAEVILKKGKPTYTRKIQSLPSGLITAKSRIPNMPYMITDPEEWVNRITDWTQGELAEAGVAAEEPMEDMPLAEDVPPTDGLPVADVEDVDDQPAYAD
jgi:hypothetical protein